MVSNPGAILAYLYPAADPRRDYRVRDSGDGTGPQVAYWNPALGAPPTSDQIAAAQLPVAQAAKVAAIDARTAAIQARGFSSGGDAFGLTTDERLNWLALYAMRDALTYPVAVTTAGNRSHSLPDATALGQFALTALGAGKSAADSGRALKDQVMAATTVDAANAVQDTRA